MSDTPKSPDDRASRGWIADDGLKTAPTDTLLIAATMVRNQSGKTWWDKHLILIEDETGEIAEDLLQGWDRCDYTHWQLAPDDPVVAAADEPVAQEAGLSQPQPVKETTS